MVQLSGLSVQDSENPQGDIEIVVTGLRPGEKLYEELLIGENPVSTNHPLIMMAREEYLNLDYLMREIELLKTSIKTSQVELLISQLKRMVQGYQHS
jgi:FlaA1/EpsC-like NDP-sugar epimerase